MSNRFTDNGDGTVTDNQTGLMWQNDETLLRMRWQDAIDYCSKMSLAGYRDWRLPSITELISIIDFSKYDFACDDIFNTVSSLYWSSTSAAYDSHDAWIVGFGYGNVGGGFKNYGFYVRAVRGGY